MMIHFVVAKEVAPPDITTTITSGCAASKPENVNLS
jgi:hypothetical protein